MIAAVLSGESTEKLVSAGDLEAERLEFLMLGDMQSGQVATIGTAFSYFPDCCS